MRKIIFLIMAVIMNLEAKEYKFTNHLIDQDSPYLLQHAHNPVNWYPWCKEAFEKAKREHKLIFLSIGYSTCHWCHVMEKESFEDEEVAKVLNRYYVSIKVDREEMPSVDKHFQDIFYLMHKRAGGWPLTIILTPDAKPFFSATYIPKESMYNRAGLLDLLKYFADLQKRNYKKIQSAANEVKKYFELMQKREMPSRTNIKDDMLKQFVNSVKRSYDGVNHGIGLSPKFPHASTIKTLLEIYRVAKNKEALKMAVDMLRAMAKGGIYDQVEGGFFRYSTDKRWVIPHFEKMLYTNAELLEDYALAYEITKEPLFERIIKELVAFLEKRFEYNGLFYSASDADSFDSKSKEKKEGAYFVYSYDEAKKALENMGAKNTKEVLSYFGITKRGNFEGKNNLNIKSLKPKPKGIQKLKEALLKLREQREYPFVDHKMLTSWNALLIKALFKASFVDNRAKKMAFVALDEMIKKLYIKGELYHQVLPNKNAKIKANLEDYAFFISALIDGYEASFDDRYLDLGDTLAKKALEIFYKKDSWYSATKPFKIKATFETGSYVNALGIMVDDLLKLAVLKENLSYQKISKQTIYNSSYLILKYPINFPQAILDLIALDRGYVVVKSTKENLINIKKEISKSISYPFILCKKSKEKKYLACGVDSCFAYAKSANELLAILSERLQ